MKKKIKKIFLEEFHFWEVIILMCLSAVVGITLGKYILKNDNASSNISMTNSTLQEFINNYQYIVNNYYGELDEEQMLNKALQGILEEIDDPYAAYMDENEANNFEIQLSGSYQGVGIEIGNLISTGDLVITKVFDDSPAKKAGLQSGDVIKKFNGEILENVTSAELSKKIKKINGQFEMSVLRDEEEITYQIIPETIVLKSVDSQMLENNIGYISISLFAENTYEQIKSHLGSLEDQGVKSLIIDVRNNVGGYLTSVEKILSLFLDSSHIIYQTEDKSGVKKYYSSGKTTKQYPVVVLTNASSASASEILTAALKEELGALSVGQKTYGKGTAQKLHTLSDGTKYKFTSQKWLTPSGKSIDGNGIDVDVEVVLDEKYYQEPTLENDNQLQTAIRLLQEN